MVRLASRGPVGVARYVFQPLGQLARAAASARGTKVATKFSGSAELGEPLPRQGLASGQIVDARAPAQACRGGITPQRLHGERPAAVALDVAERARDREGSLPGGWVEPHPRALVAVLVGV